MKSRIPWIAGTALILLVCAMAGCAMPGKTSPSPPDSSNPGGYHQDAYFSIECTGKWSGGDEKPIGDRVIYEHGQFTAEGNIPITMDFDYRDVPASVY